MSDRSHYNPIKTFQAIGVLLEQIPTKTESYIRILKLLYIADRDCLKQIGRTLTGDKAVAMKNGPVLSRTYNAIKGEDPTSPIWSEFFQRVNYRITLIKNPGNGKLSRFEIGLLNEIQEKYQTLDDWDLVDVTHEFKEWKESYQGENTSYPISLESILDALGMSENLEYILEKQQEAECFNRFFSGE